MNTSNPLDILKMLYLLKRPSPFEWMTVLFREASSAGVAIVRVGKFRLGADRDPGTTFWVPQSFVRRVLQKADGENGIKK